MSRNKIDWIFHNLDPPFSRFVDENPNIVPDMSIKNRQIPINLAKKNRKI